MGERAYCTGALVHGQVSRNLTRTWEVFFTANMIPHRFIHLVLNSVTCPDAVRVCESQETVLHR